METIIIEMLTVYAPQLMQTALYFIAGILAILAAKYVKPLLQNKVVKVLAKNAVLFVEQTVKDLHGDDKLNEALKALSLQLAKWSIKISAEEMKVMLEAAVAEFNGVFNGQAAAKKLTE